MNDNIVNTHNKNEVKMEICLKHNKPVDVIAMANSLIALNNLTLEHISKEHGVKDTKILLTGVKEGSDVYQLVIAFAAASLPLIDNAVAVLDFLQYVRSYLSIDKKPIEEIMDNRHYNLNSAKNIEAFLAPIENDNENSQMNINVVGDNNTVFVISPREKKQILENTALIKRIVENKNEEDAINKTYHEVLIKLHKVLNTTKEVRDSAYCDAILPNKAIPTIFENENDKEEILNAAINNHLYLVDIETMVFGEEIKLYKVKKLHKILPDIDKKGEDNE
jgi:hypothetical protein